MTAFWEAWAAALTRRIGNWGVELLSGLLFAAAAIALTPWWWARAVLALGGSAVYERYVDPRGWAWADVGPRTVGILLAFGLWALRALLVGGGP